MNRRLILKKSKKDNLKDSKAITLIALIITIVILIILAGILINITIGNNGIIQRAKEGKKLYINAQEYEQGLVNGIDDKIKEYIHGTGSLDTPQDPAGDEEDSDILIDTTTADYITVNANSTESTNDVKVGDTITYRNTTFRVNEVNGNTIKMLSTELKAHIKVCADSSDTSIRECIDRNVNAMHREAATLYSSASNNISAKAVFYSDHDLYKAMVNSNSPRVFQAFRYFTDFNQVYLEYCYLNGSEVAETAYPILGSGASHGAGADVYFLSYVTLNSSQLTSTGTGTWTCSL